MSVAFSSFSNTMLCIMAGLTWCGTSDPEVQISFAIMDLTFHLSGAQHPTVIVRDHFN